jgi:hypothetical protein
LHFKEILQFSDTISQFCVGGALAGAGRRATRES